MPRIAHKALQLTWKNMINQELRDPGYCKIIILGVGGAGNNTVTRLMETGNLLAESIAINTDINHLKISHANYKILIGEKLTHGMGSGGDPKIGRGAIKESSEQVEQFLEDIDIAFITAGMGGGTGTGASPLVARIAREKGAIVIGVVTMPFKIEMGRLANAIKGLNELQLECDTVIVIDNNKLTSLVPQLAINEAFKVCDGVLANMIIGITETISLPSLINLDFADFRTIIQKGGIAIAGIGQSDAPNRVEESVRKALRMPLLDVDYIGAKGALIHVAGDNQMTIDEANRVGEIITQMMSEDSLVIWGARVNPDLAGTIKVTVVLTGVPSKYVLENYVSGIPGIYQMDPLGESKSVGNLNFNLYNL
jgi:cell division protein FtsZ